MTIKNVKIMYKIIQISEQFVQYCIMKILVIISA